MKRVLATMFVLGCLMAGCEEEPVGLPPVRYCHQLNEITGSVAATCPDAQERAQRERPVQYECMSHCVETSADIPAFDACSQGCTDIH